MKKIILKLSVNDEKDKRKALHAVSSLFGVESMSMDMKDKKVTVIGDVDPVEVASKLRKKWSAEVVSIGPAKEDKKGEKKEEKKDEKKDEKKEDPKEEEEKKKKQIEELYNAVKSYNPYKYHTPQYFVVMPAVEENPNTCVIC